MKAEHLQYRKLVLKKLDCLDQNVFNLKIHETETMQRLGQNSSICQLYAYWQEIPDNPFIYRTLYQLFEECELGDLESTVICSAIQPPKRTIVKYACGIAKGLFAYHQIGLIHGGIRPNNILLDMFNDTKIGPAKKTELEYTRKMRHLISKYCFRTYLKIYFVFWAPELFIDYPTEQPSDIWALGIIIYVLYTNDYPFDVTNEESCMNAIKNVTISYRKLDTFPRLQK